MYEERRSTMPSTVVWRRVVGSPMLIVPDGCTDVIWTGDSLVVAGPDTRAHLAAAADGRTLTALRFAPGVGPAVFRVGADELRDRRLALGELWPDADVRRLGERLADAIDPGAVLERTIAERMDEPSPLMAAVARLLAAGAPIGAVADEVGMSARQLHRRSLLAFGYGPKVLERILRLGRAMRLARRGAPLARVAASCGYADQPHLTREVKLLCGVTPRELLRAEPTPAGAMP